MATVYLAEDLKLHRRVALKVLRPELAAMLGNERFLREIEVAAGLSHPPHPPTTRFRRGAESLEQWVSSEIHDNGRADASKVYRKSPAPDRDGLAILANVSGETEGRLLVALRDT